MSVSGISSSTTIPSNGARADFQQLRDSYKGIDSALQAGDLDAAKQALDDFKQALQGLPGRRGDQSQSGKPTQITDDLKALDTAVQSGDTDAAKKAFETLTKDMQSLRHARGHHRHHKDADDQASTSTDTTNTTTTTTGTTNTTTGTTPSVDISV
jgi:soluble cytochrome b562